MTTTEKKPRAKKAKPTAADQVAKLRQTTLEIPAPDNGPELLMVPLELIDTAAQVRTEFDNDSIAELAADLAARGVLQPVLLRRMEGGRYLMIAGERRLRAARLAQLPAIPALAGEIDSEAAEDMQLAENIQRENLSLEDTAKAVRRLFDRLGSLQAVADKVHKSKPWVSKRLAVTCDEFHWGARQLLEDGVCEDLETLLALSKCYEISWQHAQDLATKIRAGQAGRQTARDTLQAAKDWREEMNKPQAPEDDDHDGEEGTEPTPEPNRFRTPENLLWHLTYQLTTDAVDAVVARQVLAYYQPQELQQLHEVLTGHHARGLTHLGNGYAAIMREAVTATGLLDDDDYPTTHPLVFFAFAEGAMGNEFDLPLLLDKLISHINSFKSAEASA